MIMMVKNDNNYKNDKPGEIHQASVFICAPWSSVLDFGNGIRAGKEDQLSLTIAWFDHLRLLHKYSDMPILQSHLYASLCHNWHFCSVTAATVVAGISETMQSCHHVRAFLYSKWGSEERSFVSKCLSLSSNHSLSFTLSPCADTITHSWTYLPLLKNTLLSLKIPWHKNHTTLRKSMEPPEIWEREINVITRLLDW